LEDKLEVLSYEVAYWRRVIGIEDEGAELLKKKVEIDSRFTYSSCPNGHSVSRLLSDMRIQEYPDIIESFFEWRG